jgi:uncharacterized membrane protein YbjE (DUF340 family)
MMMMMMMIVMIKMKMMMIMMIVQMIIMMMIMLINQLQWGDEYVAQKKTISEISAYQFISVAITTQATIAELLNLLPKPQKHVINIATKREITVIIKKRER